MSRTRDDTVVLPKLPSVEQIEKDFEAANETDPAFTTEIPLGDNCKAMGYLNNVFIVR